MKIKETILGLLVLLIREVIIRPIDLFLDTLQGYFTNRAFERYLSVPLNFAPVSEERTEYDIPVTQGAIPSDLVGEFVRNGPNPESVPRGGYHWFDGDGMLHGVRLTKDGKVSYFNRFIKTKALEAERQYGMRLRLRIGEMKGVLGILKFIFLTIKMKLGLIPNDIGGTANTALVYHNNKLQALVEADVPYEVRVMNDGKFETIARLDYDGKLKRMTAHPKVDPKTKELFFFAYNTLELPLLNYGYVNATGQLVRQFPIPIPDPVMIHDFAITERYAIFFDLSLVFRKERIISGDVFKFEREHQARVGILDRYAKDASGIVWFNIPPRFSFHSANAFEEGDEVVIFLCSSKDVELDSITESIYEMTEWRCNMKTGEFREEILSPGTFSEFPQINNNYCGRKNKYAYSTTKSGISFLDGIVKYDLEKKELLGKFFYGKNKTGGEAVFVPKPHAKSEDDGYLLTFVHDHVTQQSSFWVVDAKSLTDVIAVVNLPHRVPWGFHGLFMSEADIQSQFRNQL